MLLKNYKILHILVVFFLTPLLYCDTISGDITTGVNDHWGTGGNVQSVVEIIGNVTVPPGVTLTIEPGTIIKFDGSTKLIIYGTLVADGTATDKIIFTSIKDDAHGGDTNGDGNATSPAAGDWDQIIFYGSVNDIMDNCLVMYGGVYNSVLVLQGSSPQITYNEFTNNLGTIIASSNNSSATIQNNTIDGGVVGIQSNSPLLIDNNAISNVETGINVESYNTQITNNNFDNIAAYPIALGIGVYLVNRITGNVYTNCGKYGISLPYGDYNATGTLLHHDIPYVITGAVLIPTGYTLTIEPGTIIKFEQNLALFVYGTLIADGTAADKIIFTSIKDDVHGGDTNGDGNATSPAAGDWNSVGFSGSVNDIMDNCLVMYGGFYGSVLPITGSSPQITNNEFTNNLGTTITCENSSASIEGNTIDGGDVGIHSSSSPLIDNNTISNVGTGITVFEYTTNTQITNNNFDNIATYPISLGKGAYLVNRITGNVYNNCGKYGINLPYGDYDTTGTLLHHDIPYVITGNVSIPTGDTLTIEPGTIIKFEQYQVLIVNGTLIAEGTATEKIIFTSIKDDTNGGDTNGDGNATSPAAGDWNSVGLSGSVNDIMDNCLLMYGGVYNSVLLLTGSSPQITNNEFTNNLGTVITCINSSATIQNNTIDGGVAGIQSNSSPLIDNNTISNVGIGINLESYTTNTQITNNNFDNITTYPISLGIGAYLVNRITGNVYNNCGKYGINLPYGDYDTTGTLLHHDIPYVITGNVSIPTGDTLTIEPGTIIKFEQYQVLIVNGTLIAEGTATEKIIFTSIKDDTHGGDTNGDGNATNPAAGDWSSVELSGSINDIMDNCIVMYGGVYGSVLPISGSSPHITNNEFTDNFGTVINCDNSSATIQNNIIDGGDIGIDCTNSNPAIDNNSVINHGMFGIRNNTNSIIIDAQNNWWGDATGPLDNSDDTGTGGWYNPGGLGSSVSDYINYQNWLEEEPVFTDTKVNLKVFLEGPYNGSGAMTTTLNSNNLIPLNSDVAYPAATYGYTPSVVTSIPNSDIVDWVLVEIRTGTTSGTKQDERAAFIKSDGTIVDTDGTSPVTFTGLSAGDYYVVVRHRNHLAIMTATAIPLIGSSTTSYDFTTSQSEAYGTNAMKDLEGGVYYGMFAGDANANGQIQNNDRETYWVVQNGQAGYKESDYNLNGQVQNNDNETYWVPNNGKGTQVP